MNMKQTSNTMTAPCTHCGKGIDLRARGIKELAPNKNIYCNKGCMGKAQTKRATLELECAYCCNNFTTLKGRHSENNLFCNQTCAFAVRKDRYFWTILHILSNQTEYLSADQIRSKLKTRKVDLTPMRIATRISNNPMIDVNKESEPFTYSLKEQYRKTPWRWHTSKFYRKMGTTASEYHKRF